MDSDDARALNRLLHAERVAHLATLRDGAPMNSMTLFAPESDFSAFYIHVSRLAWHTQDLMQDPRCALSIAETDDGRPDPFTLQRVTIRGAAARIENDDPLVADLKTAWLTRFQEQAINFELGDFAFWRITPRDARFVAGYGRIHNLSSDALRDASA